MSQAIRALSPSNVWNHFADLNAVPRPSKKEEKVRKFIQDFGKSLGLEVITDSTGNVIIKKPASKGKEKSPTVILQGHIDMVHQKNEGTNFDFDNDGIKMFVDGDWVRAEGTTLGADNGLGVAAIMAVLSSKDMEHPAIEALFTWDEESGMSGAKALDRGLLDGKIMLNLDTEEDHVYTIGCAGGLDSIITWNYREKPTTASHKPMKIFIKGLKGGHSGMDIIKGLGNSNKLMNRILLACSENTGLAIATLDGGNVRNAIPREASAWVTVKKPKLFNAAFKAIKADLLSEFQSIEPNLNIFVEEAAMPAKVMNPIDQQRLLTAIRATHNGVFRMSPDVQGLVEASSNLAKIALKDGFFLLEALHRSSVESSKYDVADAVVAPYILLGANIERKNGYPGWKPNPKSKLVQKMVGIYEKMFGEKPVVEACHAGLECGIIAERYAGLDMISFGPTIQGAHSPDECASISSFQKFWQLFTTVLKAI